MRGFRNITVDGKKHRYRITGSGRYYHTSAPNLRMVIDCGQGRFVTLVFWSKLWTRDHDFDVDCSHRNAFPPSLVAETIRAVYAASHCMSIPTPFEVGDWSLSQQRWTTGNWSVGEMTT